MSLLAINNVNGAEEEIDDEIRRFNTTELRQVLLEDGEGKRNEDRDSEEREDVGGWEVRHGWEEQGREEYLGWLSDVSRLSTVLCILIFCVYICVD